MLVPTWRRRRRWQAGEGSLEEGDLLLDEELCDGLQVTRPGGFAQRRPTSAQRSPEGGQVAGEREAMGQLAAPSLQADFGQASCAARRRQTRVLGGRKRRRSRSPRLQLTPADDGLDAAGGQVARRVADARVGAIVEQQVHQVLVAMGGRPGEHGVATGRGDLQERRDAEAPLGDVVALPRPRDLVLHEQQLLLGHLDA
eukprot:scaffold1724_cov246-Pinguiococcus_pyrenoidosus.AAC.3